MGEKKKLVSLNEAIEILNKDHNWDPEANGRNIYSKGTIYNAIHKKEIEVHGPYHARQIEVSQLLARFGKKKNKSA